MPIATLGRLLVAALFIVSVWYANADVCRGCEVRRVAFPAAGKLIRGTLYRPPAAAPGSPAIVVCHGYLASAAFMTVPWAADLTALGAAALFIDRVGHGQSEGSWWPSDALSSATGLEQLVPDVAAAIDDLRARHPGGDAARLGLLGHSDGGTAAIVAASIDWDLRATVALSPSAAPIELVSYAAPRNLLLVYGGEDRIVDPSLRAMLIGAATGGYLAGPGRTGELVRGTARELLDLPGAGHVTLLYDPAARTAALAWLKAALRLPGPVTLSPLRFGWIGLGLAALLLAMFWPLPRAAPTCGPSGRRGLRLSIAVARAGLAAFAFGIGLLAVPHLAWLGRVIPAQESRGVGAILVALPVPLAGAAALLGGLRWQAADRHRRDHWMLGRELLEAFGYGVVILFAGQMLCAHLVPVPLDPPRMALWAYFALLSMPFFASLDWLVAHVGRSPLERGAAYLVAAVTLALSASLLAERMGVLPIYLLAATVGILPLSLQGASATWSPAGRMLMAGVVLGRLLSIACPLHS